MAQGALSGVLAAVLCICAQTCRADGFHGWTLRGATNRAECARSQVWAEADGLHVRLDRSDMADRSARWIELFPGREVLVARPTSERAGRYADLEYNFAIRMGDIAVIGLDTGEDKPDGNPANAWSSFTPYRRVQAEWLEEQFRRPEIAAAPYIVAAAHIPLVAPYRNVNPGTSL